LQVSSALVTFATRGVSHSVALLPFTLLRSILRQKKKKYLIETQILFHHAKKYDLKKKASKKKPKSFKTL
jgi:hypothetical protein